MTEIRVDPQFLANRSRRLRKVAEDLRQYTAYGRCNLSSATRVAQAYAGLNDDWDFNREALVRSLNDLADGFDKARDSFTSADQQLAEALTQAE